MTLRVTQLRKIDHRSSGLVLLRRHLGGSTLAVTVVRPLEAVVIALLVVARSLHLVVAAAITPLVKTTVASVITTGAIVIALEARKIGIVR